MKLYNTLSGKKEEFIPIVPGEVKMYICGPTVYNLIHVGNARPMIIFDVLRRYFTYKGYKVTFVQNFTDVDDKIIRRANEEGASSDEIARKYIEEYFKDADGLGVLRADVHPKATENIGEIIDMVKKLIDKGYAYVSGGDVYFRTNAFKNYGALSRQPLDELEAGARVEVSEAKESPVDFALWKASKPGEPAWPSPWGEGRPGWHIECSAMSNRYLGKTIDIHCGGQDLIFPHHENEIAQSECANGSKFVNYWLHNGFLSIDNKKMSKSLGNFFTVRDAAQAYGYEAIRFFMLSASYRSPLNYSAESLEQSAAALERLYTTKGNLEFLMNNGADGDMREAEKARLGELAAYKKAFEEAMDDDMNTADALSAVFEMVREINTAVANDPTKAFAGACLEKLSELTGVLGLLYGKKEESLDERVRQLIEERQAARKARNFSEADRIRDELKSMGVILEDTPQGVKWRKA
ncbi:MAG: cysteine--tRNA ligase [Clostridiales bacterium]|nr:cysteine--tRNA ligase [Clostridiales bacterium]